MEKGKQLCRILKDIRKKIAEENDIEFITSECQHKGECAGTCPKCEAEVRYLEQQLARRRYSGRQTRIAGLSLGIAAVAAPVLLSCSTDGKIEPPLMGDPVTPENVQLGENLIFDLIPASVFLAVFETGSWVETEIYDVYPDGSLGEEIIGRSENYSPLKMYVSGEGKVTVWRSADEDPEIKEFFYNQWSNNLNIKDLMNLTIASVNNAEMICYGPVFSQQQSPDAFIGKYVFKHLNDE